MSQLSDATVSKISQALKDKDAAVVADDSLTQKTTAAVQAAQDEADAQAADLQAHQVALESAHEALAGVAADLNIKLV